jgi:hypothetical protein
MGTTPTKKSRFQQLGMAMELVSLYMHRLEDFSERPMLQDLVLHSACRTGLARSEWTSKDFCKREWLQESVIRFSIWRIPLDWLAS